MPLLCLQPHRLFDISKGFLYEHEHFEEEINAVLSVRNLAGATGSSKWPMAPSKELLALLPIPTTPAIHGKKENSAKIRVLF